MPISQRDKKHIWHPLTQHNNTPDALGITKAKGTLLFDESGKIYIDAISSWYTAVYGHCHPILIEAAYHQMRQLDQVVFAGFTHEPAVKLTEKIIPLLPYGQNRVFFSENGSTAVDIALKIAIQYFHNKGDKRKVFVAFEEGFHGDTFGAMSVSGLSVYNGAFEDFFIEVKRIPVPTEENIDQVLQHLKNILDKGDVAAFIYEPLVQGAAGMKMHEAKNLCQILRLCKQYDVLKIADEVMTGFRVSLGGAQELYEITPDLTALGKVIGGGLPVGAFGGKAEIMNFLAPEGPVYQAGTLSGNPLAVAAGKCLINELIKTNPYDELEANASYLLTNIKNEMFKKEIPFSFNQIGGMFGFFFTKEFPNNFDDVSASSDKYFESFFKDCLNQGIYFAPSKYEAGFISTKHTKKILDEVINKVKVIYGT